MNLASIFGSCFVVVLSVVYTLNEIFYSKLNNATGLLNDNYRSDGYINTIYF